MKKFFYTSLLGAALLVQPVTGSESQRSALAASHGTKSAPQVQLAANSTGRFERDALQTDMTALSEPASPERTDWTLIGGALLFIGVVIRRRTAVR